MELIGANFILNCNIVAWTYFPSYLKLLMDCWRHIDIYTHDILIVNGQNVSHLLALGAGGLNKLVSEICI